MDKMVLEIHGETKTPYVKTMIGHKTNIEDAALYVVGWDLKDEGKADEIKAAIAKAVADKTMITLTYGEDMTAQRIAEAKAYDAHCDMMTKAMHE
jgi:hypothetical protein